MLFIKLATKIHILGWQFVCQIKNHRYVSTRFMQFMWILPLGEISGLRYLDISSLYVQGYTGPPILLKETETQSGVFNQDLKSEIN